MGADYTPGKGMFESQPLAVLNQANPTQNLWYTIFDEENCRVYKAAFNIEDADETLEVRITRNGVVTATIGIACTNSITYFTLLRLNAINRTIICRLDNATQQSDRHGAFLCEARSVVIEVRKTTALGVGNLTGVVDWGQLS